MLVQYKSISHKINIDLKIRQLLPAIYVVTCAHVLDDVFEAADWLSIKARGTCFDICQNGLKVLKTRKLVNFKDLLNIFTE